MLGRREAEHDAVAVKDLRDPDGTQIEVPRRDVAGWLQARREQAVHDHPGVNR